MFDISAFKRSDLAIDLGNNNTILSDQEKILCSQPSYIVLQRANNEIKAVGTEAYDMYEKTHEQLKPVRPLKGGVIADYDSAEKMIKSFVTSVYNQKFWGGFNNIISGVPFFTTEVEKRALRDALQQFNARNTSLIYEPIAAAIGLGLDIQAPDGIFLVDIGGGITEIVVISLSGVVSFQSEKTAGDSFDEDIQDYMRKNYNLSIGIKTAEQVKIRIGAVTIVDTDQEVFMEVKGKDMITGIPVTKKVSSNEIATVLDKSFTRIEQCILNTLETCPPELAGDIFQSGIYVTGGNALLKGVKERLERIINLPVKIDPNPLLSVTRGISKVLAEKKAFGHLLIN